MDSMSLPGPTNSFSRSTWLSAGIPLSCMQPTNCCLALLIFHIHNCFSISLIHNRMIFCLIFSIFMSICWQMLLGICSFFILFSSLLLMYSIRSTMSLATTQAMIPMLLFILMSRKAFQRHLINSFAYAYHFSSFISSIVTSSYLCHSR